MSASASTVMIRDRISRASLARTVFEWIVADDRIVAGVLVFANGQSFGPHRLFEDRGELGLDLIEVAKTRPASDIERRVARVALAVERHALLDQPRQELACA